MPKVSCVIMYSSFTDVQNVWDVIEERTTKLSIHLKTVEVIKLARMSANFDMTKEKNWAPSPLPLNTLQEYCINHAYTYHLKARPAVW